MTAADHRALGIVLGKIQRIAAREVADGYVPTHVLDRAPRPSESWVLVSTYAALALEMLDARERESGGAQ